MTNTQLNINLIIWPRTNEQMKFWKGSFFDIYMFFTFKIFKKLIDIQLKDFGVFSPFCIIMQNYHSIIA